ncbi:unnamed protein product [Oikopleura dioica]|uniref:Photolyase/cryptochrome alpha/beta domain-containing protein n=1 Tax=Oikopleura dioica TaxID=34765 RepID=E4X2Z2_OIKDI|nr:unnamed protein product [Oikopleura dioica]
MERNLTRHRTLHWFRKGLRLHDNRPLLAAIRSSEAVYCVYCLDLEWMRANERIGNNRIRFLLESLTDLDENLRKIGTRLFVLRGNARTAIKTFCREYEITQMTYMRDAEVFYRQLEAEILEEVNRREIVTRSDHGHTLYDPQEIIDANEGQVPLSLDEFYSVIPSLDVPALPAPTVTAEMFKSCSVRIEENHQAIYGVPTMASLGLECPRAHTRWPGGETVALERLKYKMKQNTLYEFNQGPSTSKAANHEYEIPGTSEPWFETQPETTGLSPYINLGSISPRTFWHGAKNCSEKMRTTVQGQMIYREFFYTVAYTVNNFTRIEGNRICKDIKWSDPKTNERAAEWIEKFKQGMTGYPWIDAAVRQMKTEGWITHISRFSLASFLTVGQMWCSWEVGQQLFEEFLLDADYALNAGNFLWVTGSAFANQIPVKALDPVKLARKWDTHGSFIRRYCPELKNLPTQYICAPWKAPQDVQLKARAIIGVDYPAPMLNAATMRIQNLNKIKAHNQQIRPESDSERDSESP